MTTSKIKVIQHVKPFENSHGTTYYHNVEMDNGDKINIGKKKELQVGWELTYEIIGDESQEYRKAKSVNPEFSQSSNSGSSKPVRDNNNQAIITIQTCAKIASEQYAIVGKFGTPEEVGSYAKELAELLIKGAEELNK